MALQAKAAFAGLVSAVAETAAPAGALRVADNVTLRKAGALQSRESFGIATGLSRPYQVTVVYRGSTFFVGPDNSLYSPAQTLIGTKPAARADMVSLREARNNLYLASSEGAFKISSIADTALTPAGLSPAAVAFYTTTVVTTGTPLLLAANQQVAYRLVAKTTDANGLEIRSRPSGARVIQSAAVAATPSFVLSLKAATTVTEVEIYRTRVFPTSVQPDDEMQLVATIARSQFVGGTPLFTFVDRIADIARGTTLYTSPSRGGIENANDRPPGAAAIERYEKCLFFGNIRGPSRVTMSWNRAGVATGSATGIGVRNATGAMVSGNTSITGVSPLTGVQVGMFARGGGLNAQVTAIAGGTVTVSTAPTVTNAAANIAFADAIWISYPGQSAVASPQALIDPTYAEAVYQANAGTAFSAYEVTPPIAGYETTLTVETYARGLETFASVSGAREVRATHGDEYSPPIPSFGAATSLYMKADTQPHGIAWSDPDQPEHVPPKNYAVVGDAGREILGLSATRDSLFIFKEDGIFRLSGTNGTWRIDTFDTTALCVCPRSIRRLQNIVYLLTNIGVVAVSESGVQIVSRPIQDELSRIITYVRSVHRATGVYNMPGLTGMAAAVDESNGEYLLAVGSIAPSFGGEALVYSAQADGWTTYSWGLGGPLALSVNAMGQPLAIHSTRLLEPTQTPGVMVARVAPHGFAQGELLGKLWTHVLVGVSRLTGGASVQLAYSSSESMLEPVSTTEAIELPLVGGLLQLPGGSLMRHPLPRAYARAWTLRLEVILSMTSGGFVLEMIGAESRDGAPNKRPMHATGAS